uniref:KH domain containing, RNA binding, signal transduction associated 2 n=1 Tax=Sinocyclocheilus grahami TaxID=75366 RepID=A0A672JW52_SINGR
MHKIEKFEGDELRKDGEVKKYLDIISNKNIKLSERVLIPVQQYPKGYDDGYDGEYDDQSYEGYDDNYSNKSKRYTFIFKRHFSEEDWMSSRPNLKAPASRLTRGGYRDHPYGRY